jgi:hypothetical protein
VAGALRTQDFMYDQRDEYFNELLKAAALCEPDYGSMGVVGYNYNSVMDAIKDTRLKRKHRTLLCHIGRLVFSKENIEEDDGNVEQKIQMVFGGSSLLKKGKK